MLFCAPAGSNSLAISAKANRTDKFPYPHKRPVAYGTNRLMPAAAAGIPLRSNVVGTRFPLPPSENAALFWVLTLRLRAPHFSTGGVAPYVAEVFSAVALKTSCSPPLAELGRCHSACGLWPQRLPLEAVACGREFPFALLTQMW